MPTPIEQLKREAMMGFDQWHAANEERGRQLDATLEAMREPDVEAMITRPAATVAGSVSLLDATMSMLNRPAPVAALTLALIVARYVPVTDADARRAVEGQQLDEVA